MPMTAIQLNSQQWVTGVTFAKVAMGPLEGWWGVREGGGSGAKQGTERVGRAGSKGRLSHKANNNYVECFLHSDQIILITPGVKINMLPSQICNYAYLIAIVIKCTLFDRTPTRGRTHIPAHILVNELKALWQNEV